MSLIQASTEKESLVDLLHQVMGKVYKEKQERKEMEEMMESAVCQKDSAIAELREEIVSLRSRCADLEAYTIKLEQDITATEKENKEFVADLEQENNEITAQNVKITDKYNKLQGIMLSAAALTPLKESEAGKEEDGTNGDLTVGLVASPPANVHTPAATRNQISGEGATSPSVSSPFDATLPSSPVASDAGVGSPENVNNVYSDCDAEGDEEDKERYNNDADSDDNMDDEDKAVAKDSGDAGLMDDEGKDDGEDKVAEVNGDASNSNLPPINENKEANDALPSTSNPEAKCSPSPLSENEEEEDDISFVSAVCTVDQQTQTPPRPSKLDAGTLRSGKKRSTSTAGKSPPSSKNKRAASATKKSPKKKARPSKQAKQ